ncbi:MAG TPA: SNF2-related protein [Ilumatobacteraceae bacterium]|nr:SNF2-related protein [Ilumatobacteraceae bacterium]
MPTRPNAAPSPGLQLTWLDGEVVAWQPGRGVYGGNLQAVVSSTFRRPLAAHNASMRVVRMALPGGEQQVMCQRLTVASLASLGQLDALGSEAGASVGWLGAAYSVAMRLVTAGRILPQLTDTGLGWWVARWKPLRADLAKPVEELAASQPPVVAVASPGFTAEELTTVIIESFVDQTARLLLAGAGWHAPVTDTRRLAARAARATARALSAPAGEFRADAEMAESLDDLAAMFEHTIRRAEGEPVVRARLRLALPDEPDDDWPLSLELVDPDDRGRWCTEAEVANGGAAAMRLAGDPRYLPLLAECLATARVDIEMLAPWLTSWLGKPDDGVDLDSAAATLEAVDALAAVDIELLTPERLTRRSASSKGVAQPKDAVGSGRFSAAAIIDWTVVVDDAPVDEALLERAAASGAGLINVNGRWVRIDRTEARRALANLAEHRRDHAELTTLELLRLAAELAATEEARQQTGPDGSIVGDTDITPAIAAKGWLGDLLQGLPDEALSEGVEPPGFMATLRPYQRRGLGWLQFLHKLGLGGCLADDMGLGKTPTTLAHLAALPGPHLVICPLSVVRNWEAEAARFTPFLRVAVHHGTGRSGVATFANLVAQHDLIITTYHVAARDIETMKTVRWAAVVLDEAQAVKNPETRSARALRSLPAEQHIALTGTPVENRLSELWSIMSMVTPGLLGSLTQFRQRFATPIERNHDLAAAAALRQLTSPFLLRRTKADKSLVPDLPDKVEQLAWASLTREQASMYQGVVDQLLADAQQATGMRRRGLVLAALTRLKQICNHPAHALGDGSRLGGRSGKLTRFDELVTDLLDAGEQALVFTQFREMGLLLQRHLVERFAMPTPFLHGGVPRKGRDRMVDEFQSNSASPLLLVSLRAGGTGLNLTAASRVVHYDRWWNPAVEDQATDRAWRIGQTRSVFVHKLVCQGTIEERVDAMINDKRALADAVVGTTGETWLSELSTDELRDLIVLDHNAVRGA